MLSIAAAVKYRCIKGYAFMRRIYIKTVRRVQGIVMCRKVMLLSAARVRGILMAYIGFWTG